MQSTDIRLIVQDEGIETVKKVINRQEDEYLRDILKRVVSKIWFRSFTYFYWNEATENEIEEMKDKYPKHTVKGMSIFYETSADKEIETEKS